MYNRHFLSILVPLFLAVILFTYAVLVVWTDIDRDDMTAVKASHPVFTIGGEGGCHATIS